MRWKAMRSENGSSLVALLATLAVIGALAAVLVHPSSGNAPASAPAPQDAVGVARGAVQAIDAAQGRTATTP